MWILYPGRIGVWSVGFCGERKTGEPGEKSSEQDENNNKLKPHMAPGWNQTITDHQWPNNYGNYDLDKISDFYFLP